MPPHLPLTRRKPPFALDRAAARLFLAEALLRWKYENITGPRPGKAGRYGDGWTLEPGWDMEKLVRDDLDHAVYLVSCAADAGAITCPPGLSLDLLITATDFGDWMYDWRVSFDDPASTFALCRPYRHEFKRLGEGDPEGDPAGTGVRNAWWVLNEAVNEANRILAGYLRAHGRPGGPRRALRHAAGRWLTAIRTGDAS